MHVDPLIKQGWLRAAAYFAGIAIIILLFQQIGNAILLKAGIIDAASDFGVGAYLLYLLMAALIVVFTWFMRTAVDRKTFKSLGFALHGYSNEVMLGTASALAILGSGTMALIAGGLIVVTRSNSALVPLAFELAFMAAVALTEELLFRGYLLNNLMQSVNKWLALAITSFLFALFHQTNPDITVFALLNIVLAGFLLGLTIFFRKTCGLVLPFILRGTIFRGLFWAMMLAV